MAILGREITDFIIGEALEIRRGLVGVPTGRSVSAARLWIKTTGDTADEDALVYNEVNSTLSSQGVITDPGSGDGEGDIIFTIAAEANEATLLMDSAGALNAVLFTAVEAGQAGNNITVEFVNNGANQSLSVTVSGLDITVNLATNGASAVTSTADDIIALINADTAASALVSADNAGLGSGTVTVLARTNLTTGNGGTASLAAGTEYFYIIKVVLDDGTTLTIENGRITGLDSTDNSSTTAATTGARAALRKLGLMVTSPAVRTGL